MTDKLVRPTMPDGLVGLTEIATRCHISRQAASRWAHRPNLGFPEPMVTVSQGPVFWWPEVEQWLRQTGREQYLAGPDAQRRINRFDAPEETVSFPTTKEETDETAQ